MPNAARLTVPRRLPLALLVLLGAALGLSFARAADGPSFAGPVGPLRLLRWRSVGPSLGGRVIAVAGVAQDPDLLVREGDCLHEPLLHSRLASEVGLPCRAPTRAEYTVSASLEGKAAASDRRLHATLAKGLRIL